MLDWFNYHGHICISFDILGLSVFDFLVSSAHCLSFCSCGENLLAHGYIEVLLFLSVYDVFYDGVSCAIIIKCCVQNDKFVRVLSNVK